MMYKYQNKVTVSSKKHSSSWFKTIGDFGYLIDESVLYRIKGKKEKIKIYLSSEDIGLIKTSDSLIVGNPKIGYDFLYEDQRLVIEGEAIVSKEELKGFKIPFDFDSSFEFYFFRRDRKKKEYESGVYDIKKQSFVFKKDSILNIDFIINGIYLSNNKVRVDKEGYTIWELEQPFIKALGLYKNELIVVAGDHVLLSIDVETGETLHKWHELKGFEIGTTYKDELPRASNFVLDEAAAKLIGVFHTYYFEIDLVSREITYIQLEEELKSHSIRNLKNVSDNPFTATHFYLTADVILEEFPNTDLNAVLALNRETKKVDWVHTFKESGIGTNTPQITDTHLYMLDLEATLHVFEKE